MLIPRPCTETLVEHVIQWCRAAPGHAEPLIADIGTGSGCIAISLAIQLKTARVVATDIDDTAIAVARRNAATHGVDDRVEFRSGAGVEPLAGGPGCLYDVICSNPPYISDDQWLEVAPNVKEYEPQGALRGGADGLAVIRSIIAGAGPLLRPGGRLVMEIADSQRTAVHDLVIATGMLANHVFHRDHEGLWRVLVAGLAPPVLPVRGFRRGFGLPRGPKAFLTSSMSWAALNGLNRKDCRPSCDARTIEWCGS